MSRKKIIYGALGTIGVGILAGAIYLSLLMPIITGYAAKNLCSGLFVAGRDALEIEEIDLNFMPINLTNNKIDYENKSVKSRFLWGSSKAIYREGYGVTLVRDVDESVLYNQDYPLTVVPGYSRDTVMWPMGDIKPDTLPIGVNIDGLRNISDKLIVKNSYNGTAFAFMVVYKGIPVAEAYREGMSEKTRFLSWSMAKSFTNALVGLMSADDIMDIYEPTGLDEWDDDDRKEITLDDLMRMSSGLEWNENYGNRSDVNVMLHCEGDMAHYVINKPLEYPIGTNWYYSSGSTNLVSYLIKNRFDSNSDYYDFAYSRLFHKIGITDAVFEVDVEGTLVGSSYLYATARDYARFGLLYLNDGVFSGTRILPEGWVDYTVTEVEESNGRYGSFFWLNRSNYYDSAPEDMFYCTGHDGQQIFIIPSKDLVMIVLGYSPSSKGGMDFNSLLGDVLGCIE